MEYKRFDDTKIMRIDPNEEILEQLNKIAKEENISLAQVSAIGAVDDFTVGVFDPKKKEYHSLRFQGTYEIVSLSGTISKMDGEIYLHIHMSAGDGSGSVVGGHLNQAIVSATAEVVIQIAKGGVERIFNKDIGLNLFDFTK